MSQALIGDSEIMALRTSIAEVKDKKPQDKWKLLQRVFTLWKTSVKDKDKALEDRKAALKSHSGYKAAYDNWMKAKKELEEAEAVAMENEDVAKKYNAANDIKFLRSEEEKIFKPMFDQMALICKKDPMQVPFNLFLENENYDTHNRFGAHFRYELGVEGVGRFYRGKNGKSPSEEVQEIEKIVAEKEKE